MDLESNSVEKQQTEGGGQEHHPSMYPSAMPGHQPGILAARPATVEWNYPRANASSLENGIPSISGYHDDQRTKDPAAFQDGKSALSSTGASTTHDYSAYINNQNPADPYSHAYQSQYYNYQHSTTDSSHQQVGIVQDTGATYQPLSSFQNASSYPQTNYSSTYYNPGDYQTTAGYQPQAAGYQSSDYTQQTNAWNNGNYASHQYSAYSVPDANAAQYSSSPAVDATHYQQQYGQWPGYYNQTAPDVMCAPGTEHMARSSVSGGSSLPDLNQGYPAKSNQPPPPGTTSWRQDPPASSSPYFQGKDVAGFSQTNDWQNRPLVFGNTPRAQAPPHFQQTLGSPTFVSVDEQRKTGYAKSPKMPFTPPGQVRPNFRPALNPLPTLEGLRGSKFQIPTNPRIATNLAFSVSKTDKESAEKDASIAPAYINVSVPSSTGEGTSHDSSQSLAKGAFPPSLRAYVERSFARCKDDAQRLSNQNILKEIITKATADGTLFTQDWDTEPLFTLPATSADNVSKGPQISFSLLSLNKLKRSPSRRAKSRWEPVVEEKPPVLTTNLNPVASDSTILNRFTPKTAEAKFAMPPSSTFRSPRKQAKKTRFSDPYPVQNGGVSSDSDKDQELTKLLSGAISMVDSPEERRKREHRSKRFEKSQEGKAGGHKNKAFRAGGGRNKKSKIPFTAKFDDAPRLAVEDMDWDSFTVRGTCQEIEKRYLRLTSAPDPSTVRPEGVLEKALALVQSTPKNYLYKCDQLKSIRQDLTVQRIRNEFTVKVYETHARLALEAGDLPEFNQCQSQLKTLYGEGINGCHFEFAAYNLLCVIRHSSTNRELVASMARLTPVAKRDEAVKHALQVRAAVTAGNYVLFFRLYKKAPNLSPCLMDLYVEKMRFEAIKCMSKSYRPTVPVSFVSQILGFSDGEDCADWLRAHGAAITAHADGNLLVDSKATAAGLYMPEPDDAVPHGDSNLAVDDFFTAKF
ncbi:SAC3/GANP/Nin1/mts3/eIF-3 p25 family isoform X2 [Wolffia australiana]